MVERFKPIFNEVIAEAQLAQLLPHVGNAMYREVIDGAVAKGIEKEIPLSILGVNKEYLEAAFDEMEKKYGTIEKYFAEGLDIGAAGQKALRAVYLGQD